MPSTPTLALVTVTGRREHAAEYHAYSTMLASRAAAAAGDLGWQVEVVAAEDTGVAGTLAAADRADALVLLGGEDIAPEFYGGARGYRGEGRHAERADEAQIALVRRAHDRGTPLLGVCRGLQIIDVAFGGTLVQDLGEGSGHRHDEVPIAQVMADHEVVLHPSSRLGAALGRSVVTRSAHHQAVARVGAGLRVAGRAPDGVIEALEHTEVPIIGVQWHPEDPASPRGQLAAVLGLLGAPAVARLAA
ncbi:gamma-glutamyl-gamma-aminobutyrate hydrolase family protein [Herbiconiux moechotypicola]|uniref:Glutamine amidotransferase n=1 Tax=Herbiconiux moechotypicola TaxID=637393 RepID=A0ABN3D836_9MICO|nr:gamma-glutamyl-gamma-aminobutyrate hydrolase family protein [Herbiconiux moechotypicola]MCS5728415.1 gamma-glutamyl-gamma-aminobutyrate hydrolase family protein [Herbiconiux moechotypicola]